MRPTRIFLLPLAVVGFAAVSCGTEPEPVAAEWEVDPEAEGHFVELHSWCERSGSITGVPAPVTLRC